MNANLDQRHFSIKSVPSKTQRRYTIGYQPKRGDCTTPAIHLSGKWLREAGFDTGTVITVKIEQGCLLLIPESVQM
ncbi:type I toxin-antitoxin system SymE family toxin [Pantoea vagans]|uniref:Type I toxin-antitoxin system SymE family toxin n=2 Tax=Erwiniaceae TaxID=1903409 RepID=A0AAN1TXC1_9GAMM|nr:type I toxin-antitoxin system SymE family toxin [Pantoea vagans]